MPHALAASSDCIHSGDEPVGGAVDSIRLLRTKIHDQCNSPRPAVVAVGSMRRRHRTVN